MVYPICVIRDAKTQFYPPQCYDSVPAAIRDFSMAVNSAKGAIAFAPGDFDMYHIGNFDTEKGEIETITPIEQIASGISVAVVSNEKPKSSRS